MRCEAEVHERLRLGEIELRRLADEIARLAIEVKLGGDGRRQAQDSISAATIQQRSLQAQMDSLQWVLTGNGDRLAS